MTYLFCQNCERAFLDTERHRHEHCSPMSIIDWENFAFCMGYPLIPNLNKEYPIFHLDLYKRLDSKALHNLKKYSPELYKREFDHWRKISE